MPSIAAFYVVVASDVARKASADAAVAQGPRRSFGDRIRSIAGAFATRTPVPRPGPAASS